MQVSEVDLTGVCFMIVVFVDIYSSTWLECWEIMVFHVYPYISIGSLMNLAKHPASTVQILGAEKALFRALKVNFVIYHFMR